MLSDFHFLRPWWLCALLPCVLLVVWFAQARRRSSPWSELIDPQLLRHLLLPASSRSSIALPALLLGSWTLTVLALAGPTWERLPEPAQRNEEAVILALELDTSMLASDVTPSRLQRARHKIADILAMRHDGLTALIVYAGDAHVVTPLSDDANTLLAMLPALDPGIMPVSGNNPRAAVELAAQLLHGSGLRQGRLMLIADAFPRSAHAAVADATRQAGLELSVLAIGSARGAPIPLTDGGFQRDRSGAITVARTNPVTMREGVELAGGRFALMSIDDADIRHLLPPRIPGRGDTMSDPRHHFDRWQDRAPWLAVVLLPLAALAFRRGWLLVVVLTTLLPSPRADALEWKDLWLRRDQQAQRALAEGDAKRAAELFRTPAWRGAARFEAGDYAAAARSWSRLDDATSHYNRGNALARSGDLEAAIAAYDEALRQQPDLEDAAANRKLVQQLLQQQNTRDPSPDDRNDASAQQPADSKQDGTPGSQAQDSAGSRHAGDDAGSEADAGNTGTQSERQDGSGTEREGPSPSDDRTQPAPPGPDDSAGEEQSRDRTAAGNAAAQPESAEDALDETATGTNGKARHGSVEEEDQRAGPQSDAGALAPAQPRSEDDEATEHWLRSLPDNPGELLRRKFEYESRVQRELQERDGW